MIASKNLEMLERSAVRLTLTVPKEHVQKRYKDLLTEYSKTVRIDGFRVGKVPPEILEKKFGKEVQMDSLQKLIEEAVEEAFKDETVKEPLYYSKPELEKDPEFSLETDLTFSVKYDVYPDIALPDTSNIKLEIPECQVGKDDEKEELETLRERNAIVQDVKEGAKADKGMLATVSYCELDEANKPVQGTESQDFVFEIGSGKNIYKFDDEIVGMKTGEEKTITKKYPDDFEYPELSGMTKKIKVSVTKLREKILPAVDDEFAQDISEKFKTADDLKTDIKNKLQKEADDYIKAKKEKALLEELVSRTKIDIPETMIEASLSMRLEQLAQRFGMNSYEQIQNLFSSMGKNVQDLMNEWRPDVEKNLRSDLLVQKLIKEKNYQVTDDDLASEYATIASETGRSVDEVKKEYENPKYLDYLKEHIQQEKLFAELFASVSFKKGGKATLKDLRAGK